MPTYGNGMQGKGILRAGFLLYDFIVLDRNRGLEDPDKRIPRGRLISRKECLELFPNIEKKGLTGAGIFYDAQFYNPPRLAISFLRTAVAQGAQIGNYCEVTNFLLGS
jgi:glycerol-3-phosphate dehydrogenase